MKRFYAGIGSRQTPPDVLEVMTHAASALEDLGWILRSGAAHGADAAFERGVKDPRNKEIFLPWPGFNDRYGHEEGVETLNGLDPDIAETAENIARINHPNWKACSQPARYMHIRNVYQVRGLALDPTMMSELVICWTPGGKGGGGTGQAIRVADSCNIPVIDLGNMSVAEAEAKIEEIIS